MPEVKNPVVEVENRIENLLQFLASQGHSVPKAALKEGIARYEGASDWSALEAQLYSAPSSMRARFAVLSRAEQRALEEVFSGWDRTRSFESIRSGLRNCMEVPSGFVVKPGYRASSGIGLASVLEELLDRFESNLDMVEFKALETCLVNWGGLSYEEVLQVLDSGDEVMMQHLQVGDSQSEMTLAELAAKIRAEYQFFLRHTPKTN